MLEYHTSLLEFEGLGISIPALPIEFCSRRFVTVDLLCEMEIKSFTSSKDGTVLRPQLPALLEGRHAVATRLALVIYLLQHSCRPRNSGTLILSAVLNSNTEAVKQLLGMEVPFDERSLIAALETQNHDIAKLLLANATSLNLRDSKDLWRYVTAKRSNSIFKLLTSSGVVPPLDVISC
jgi:hypothetical protein